MYNIKYRLTEFCAHKHIIMIYYKKEYKQVFCFALLYLYVEYVAMSPLTCGIAMMKCPCLNQYSTFFL